MKLLLFAFLLLPPVFAAASEDADYLAARDAFRMGNPAKLDRLAARLKHSPLEPYLAYYQLRMRLDISSDAAIQAFLDRSDNTPLIDRMRAEWLKVLGKKKRWETFAAQYRYLENKDDELLCYALQARPYLQDIEVLNANEDEPADHRAASSLRSQHEARVLWLSAADKMPGSCAPLFDSAIANGIITEADIWRRMRLALESGDVSLARHLLKKLPVQYSASVSALNSAAANPERYLNKAAMEKATEVQRIVALYALQRLAKRSPQSAHAQWKKKSAYFNADERRYFFGWLGYEAARNHDARALVWYAEAENAPLTETQSAWRVRAALRAQDWREVLASIDSMPPQQQWEGAWRYWKARALREFGQLSDAEVLLEGVSTEHNYYGQLAAEELGASSASAMISIDYQPGEAEINAMMAEPAVQRTLALYRMGLRTDAAMEWEWATRNFDDKQLLTAAEIMRRHEMHDHAINTADRTVELHDFNLRYPAPYREATQEHIREHSLEEAWVYGLMRQESRFVAQARSAAGAAGIMQVMPATARWLAKKMGMKDYRKSRIDRLDTNLKLGTYYMKSVLSSLDNNLVLASVAYNAGPRRARQWRAQTALEGAIYVETIPFDETRRYVKNVMRNTIYYSKLLGQPSHSLKELLGVIAGSRSEFVVGSFSGQQFIASEG